MKTVRVWCPPGLPPRTFALDALPPGPGAVFDVEASSRDDALATLRRSAEELPDPGQIKAAAERMEARKLRVELEEARARVVKVRD